MSKIKECSKKKWVVEDSYNNKYEVEVSHKELNKYQIVKGRDKEVVDKKVAAKMAQWDALWAKHLEVNIRSQEIENKKKLADERTAESQKALANLEHLLESTLHTTHTKIWRGLKNDSDYDHPKPQKPKQLPRPDQPKFPREPLRSDSKYKPKLTILPDPPHIPNAPKRSDSKYEVMLGVFDKLIHSKRVKKEKHAEMQFKADHEKWQKDKKKIMEEYNARIDKINAIRAKEKEEAKNHFKKGYEKWQKAKEKAIKRHNIEIQKYESIIEEQEVNYNKAVKTWKARRNEKNLIIDEKKKEYLNNDPDAILYYCDIVLSKSKYPDYFPRSYELDYNPENKLLIVEYKFPPINSIPTTKEVQYVKSRNDFTEKHISKSQLNQLYDSILYQISLRTIQELYEADHIKALSSIVFNGFVCSIDPATGNEVNACILSLLADKEEFLEINLTNVEPKSCFRKLKGVGSAQLYGLSPVAPILTIERDDKRFVTSYGVADGLDAGINLAAMDWEDFEHLIRELFEQEFAKVGGEVKVTRTSRDGGVDAIVFDPDPLRGGKTVIQAKRYTNIVGVSAVRDLYGTLLNEGANKGILVTTSNYGSDAYKFAKGKPLVLLDGSNLLHLLQRHGHKAKIDLQEAKLILAEMEAATEKR